EGFEAGIVTDDSFGSANPLMPLTAQLIRERVGGLLAQGKVPVVTGYIAATRDGIITTLGRGGSDYTATLIAYSLDAKEVWLWTDVDGMMSADPRVVSTARVLRRISYDEAVEMAYFGAKGLQIRTLLPAKEKGILIRIRNTFNPESEGTIIGDSTDREMGVTKAVLFTRNVSMLTVKGDVLRGGVLSARVLAVLERLGVVPLMISQSVSSSSISIVLPRQVTDLVVRGLERDVITELGGGELEVERDVAAVAVIGEGMKGTPGVASRVFTAVASKGINVRMIAQGSSELNISFVVKERDVEEAVRAVHAAFIA
ncbi:MAG: aspartate kinase, partial [Nitrososphaerota archaeon]